MNGVFKSIILSSLYVLILFVVERISYKLGINDVKHDAFWFISLFVALAIFRV